MVCVIRDVSELSGTLELVARDESECEGAEKPEVLRLESSIIACIVSDVVCRFVSIDDLSLLMI